MNLRLKIIPREIAQIVGKNITTGMTVGTMKLRRKDFLDFIGNRTVYLIYGK